MRLSKRNRIFIGILLVYVAGVALLMWRLLADIDPRYRESAEESLVETAQLMAALIEAQSPNGALNAEALRPVFRDLYARQLKADIFGFEKTRVELRLYVTDQAGRVVFDSLGRHEGADFSRWRDVRLTLAGQYGARTSADVDGDPNTSVMYVAAPIRLRNEIAGVASAGKPVQSFGQYVAAARRKTLLVGATSVVAVLMFVVILSVWLVRPFGMVRDYARYVVQDIRRQRGFNLPRLSRRAAGVIGAAYDEMRDALAGRSHVADYVQTLTHELKSPLSAIRGAAELLAERDMPEPDRQRFLANIGRETQRIQELVDRMMELAALESRRGLERVEAVDLRALLQQQVDSAQAAGAARQIRVRLDVHADATVEGDALLLQRAVGNLLDNALDFSPPGGSVCVALSVEHAEARITITDEGPGIPDYADDKVFEKFYSLARPHSQKKSTGLGLSFVKEIADLHHGRIRLRNVPAGTAGAKGAQAELSLPTAGRPG